MFFRLCVLVFGLAALSACSSQGTSGASQAKPNITRSYDLVDFQFAAQSDLSVSESQGYYPFADVVWRGDPPGPRIPQIGAMFETAAARNEAVLTGQVPILAKVTLVRFHGVTDRTRYSVGGNYNIVFDLTVVNARTGEIIEPARRIAADLDAPGGGKAAQLEQSGQTQKVRVTSFISAVLRAELS